MSHPIKRHANGSIDTAHYIAQAHLIRSQSAHAALADKRAKSKTLGQAIWAWIKSKRPQIGHSSLKPADPWAIPSPHRS